MSTVTSQEYENKELEVKEGNMFAVMYHNMTHKVKESGVHTTLYRYGDTMRLRYHYTDVVIAYPDGRVELHNGGYQTQTTKERINRYLPGNWRLYQKKYTWYLWQYPDTETEYEYENGVTIMPDNTLRFPTRG